MINIKKRITLLVTMMLLLSTILGCAAQNEKNSYAQEIDNETTVEVVAKNNQETNKPPRPEGDNRPPRDEGDNKPPQDEDERPLRNESANPEKTQDGEDRTGQKYSIEQAVSDNAQLKTIAFSGLAFITGDFGADTFFPPGKVADFFGFQYMRDVDENGLGHNTTFLSIIAENVFHILNDEQIAQLVELAEEQDDLYDEYAFSRLPIIKAFRDNMEGNIPSEGQVLSQINVIDSMKALYVIDGELSYNRAKVLGDIINSLDEEQKAYLSNLVFNDSSTWPVLGEGSKVDKRSMDHMTHVAAMTYASELFSWYAGSVEADVYFCPERHGTFFGGFYMKDYPAMGNPDYFISTSVTGDKGEMFLNILNDSQKILIEEIIDLQKEDLNEIVEIRQYVSEELRKFMIGENVDESVIMAKMERYGELEGQMSYLYASRLAEVEDSLTSEQKEALYELRDLDIYPEGLYKYSEPISNQEIESDTLFE